MGPVQNLFCVSSGLETTASIGLIPRNMLMEIHKQFVSELR